MQLKKEKKKLKTPHHFFPHVRMGMNYFSQETGEICNNKVSFCTLCHRVPSQLSHWLGAGAAGAHIAP